MELDRVEDRDVQTLVHEPVAGADAPQRRCAHHVGRTLPSVLNDSISSADVMKRKVAEGMNDLAAESCGNRERATIDERSRSRGSKRAGMTNVATDGIEKRIATRRGCRYRVLATGSASGCHEISKRQYIATIILRILYGIERRREGDVDYTLSRAG